jgi:capsid portal protein
MAYLAENGIFAIIFSKFSIFFSKIFFFQIIEKKIFFLNFGNKNFFFLNFGNFVKVTILNESINIIISINGIIKYIVILRDFFHF